MRQILTAQSVSRLKEIMIRGMQTKGRCSYMLMQWLLKAMVMARRQQILLPILGKPMKKNTNMAYGARAQ